MKSISRIVLILFSFLFLVSCGTTTHDTIVKGTRIDLPVPPKPIGIKGTQGVTLEKNTVIDPPYVAESYQYWRAYKDGAIIWKPKDWRLLNDHIKVSQNWIELANERVKSHNKMFDSEVPLTPKSQDKSWYEIWKK